MKAWIYCVFVLWTATIGTMLAFLIGTVVASIAKADIDYGPARDKTVEAAMVQTGASRLISQAQTYAENKCRYYAYKLIEPAALNTTLATIYILSHRELSVKSIRTPLKSNCSFSLSPDHFDLRLNWTF